jgi:hypothetical protein
MTVGLRFLSPITSGLFFFLLLFLGRGRTVEARAMVKVPLAVMPSFCHKAYPVHDLPYIIAL